MSNTNKYIISTFFITASVLLFVFSGNSHNKIQENGVNSKSHPINENFILDISFESIVTTSLADSLGIGETDGEILPVFIVEKNACPSSLNFIQELTEQANESLLFKSPVLLFPDTKDSFANRLLAISDVKTPFLTLQRDRLPEAVEPGVQTVLFVDFDTKEAFFKAPVPNFNTTLIHKEQLLESVAVAWEKNNE